MSKYKNLIFDLDGTLIDTIEDISFAMNEALSVLPLPQRFDKESTKLLIGDGADMAIKRALLDKGDDPILFEKLKKEYMPRYKRYQNVHAKPFPGMKETLLELKELGISLYVLTNKPHELAEFILKAHFGDVFAAIQGQVEGAPVKPDPTLTNALLEREELKKEESLFVGDSLVDILTARNASLDVVLVGWGYGTYDQKTIQKSSYFISSPSELIPLLRG